MWKAHKGLLKKKSQFRKRVKYVGRDDDRQLNLANVCQADF